MGPESEVEEKMMIMRVNAAAHLLPPPAMPLHHQPVWQPPCNNNNELRTVPVPPSRPPNPSIINNRLMPIILPSQWQQPLVNDGTQFNHAMLSVDADNSTKLKADIISHPLYHDLLSAHIDCLRAATPISDLHAIDSQLRANSQQVVSKYVILSHNLSPFTHTTDKEELDSFMAKYTMLLRALKEQLEEHVRVHTMEAVMSCWELEQALLSLTGTQTFEESYATMSDNENEEEDNTESLVDSGSGYLDGGDTLGLGPLIPTETERSLMERVRRELKLELKQGYRHRISSVREEILRKRRAGKLPGETTSILKKWWNAHSKWPYPTEDEKAKLVQETCLELKQINNWFINQRKRNWHNSQSSSSVSLSKGDQNLGQPSNASQSISSDAHRLANEYYI